MAYLSSDQITGKVLVNLHSDGLAIYNNTSIERNIEKQKIYHNTVTVSSSNSKFNKGSIFGWIRIPVGEDLSGDFTYSTWANIINGYYRIRMGVYKQTNSGLYYKIISFSDNAGGQRVEAFKYDITSDNPYIKYFSDNIYGKWHHFVITRKNGTIYYFIDGKIEGTYDSTSIEDYFVNTNGYELCIVNGAESGYQAYLDDIVVIKDQCLWSSEFDPPTEKLIGYDLPYTQTLYSTVNEKDKIKIYY